MIHAIHLRFSPSFVAKATADKPRGSNKDYGCEWDYDWRNKRFQRDDNTGFSVNLVVYALGA